VVAVLVAADGKSDAIAKILLAESNAVAGREEED